MQIIEGWQSVPAELRGASLAIGNFDGLHHGHQAVIAMAKMRAAALQAPCGVMVFEPHPRKYFRPNKPFFRLTTLPQKLRLLEAQGCDFTAIVPFNQDLAALIAEEFAAQVLAEGYGIQNAAVGFNFFFGKNRGGSPSLLAQLGQTYGFGVDIVEPKGDAGEIYSSTRIRELLAEGDVATAADLLGAWWRVSGMVESGAGRGTGLGFPTANVRLEEGIALKHGIYAVRVYVEDHVLKGASYLGTRPTFDAGLPLLETFLFDFNDNLYGKTLEIEFIAFIRGDAKFRSADALSQQMAEDCAKARMILDELDV